MLPVVPGVCKYCNGISHWLSCDSSLVPVVMAPTAPAAVRSAEMDASAAGQLARHVPGKLTYGRKLAEVNTLYSLRRRHAFSRKQPDRM